MFFVKAMRAAKPKAYMDFIPKIRMLCMNVAIWPCSYVGAAGNSRKVQTDVSPMIGIDSYICP